MQAEEQVAARRNRMAVMARSGTTRLQELWAGLNLDPAYKMLRGPESGLITLRGRYLTPAASSLMTMRRRRF